MGRDLSPTAHAVADTLITSLYENGCQSITPPGTETFPTANEGTIIDLTFISDSLTDKLLSCQTQAELDIGLDYLPVLSQFLLQTPAAQVKCSRVWKDTNWQQAVELSARLFQTMSLDTKEHLEQYSTFLSESVRWIIEQTVPIQRPSKYANPWWNQEVADAVKEARKARKWWLDTRVELFREEDAGLKDKKRRLIAQVKTVCFRSFVHKATKEDGLYGASHAGQRAAQETEPLF
ncbi:Endonuclease/exonuclease/phosphatase [Lasallia pustulata]|uniref:Endonuclease/exonuclease/phosphatase n=1 Tax=Lasallia pustulata TaxID=136370 RepID=A0A1W5DD81_9LECA|nr:Endonuclease/exonuclease/phosphatase [Lasallia pustulata]